jgi:hypothetical protein
MHYNSLLGKENVVQKDKNSITQKIKTKGSVHHKQLNHSDSALGHANNANKPKLSSVPNFHPRQ